MKCNLVQSNKFVFFFLFFAFGRLIVKLESSVVFKSVVLVIYLQGLMFTKSSFESAPECVHIKVLTKRVLWRGYCLLLADNIFRLNILSVF